MDPDVNSRPKVSRASRLQIFEPEELHSIILLVTHTLDTPVAPHDTYFLALSRAGLRPNLILDQGDHGSSRNLVPPPLLTSGLGIVSTNV